MESMDGRKYKILIELCGNEIVIGVFRKRIFIVQLQLQEITYLPFSLRINLCDELTENNIEQTNSRTLVVVLIIQRKILLL